MVAEPECEWFRYSLAAAPIQRGAMILIQARRRRRLIRQQSQAARPDADYSAVAATGAERAVLSISKAFCTGDP